VLDVDPAPPREMGTAPPTFRPMSVVAKRSSVSATAEFKQVVMRDAIWPPASVPVSWRIISGCKEIEECLTCRGVVCVDVMAGKRLNIR